MKVSFSVAVMLLFASCQNAYGITCATSKGHAKTYWSWRLIDGKKCWYPGRTQVAKSQLHWSTPRAAPKRLIRASPSKRPEVSKLPAEQDILLHSVWPELPEFTQRWLGEPR